MPFSALSPQGPVSLLGADAMTVERLRLRNRQEACFTAKCCGAPLTVRTAPGKSAHFVHKVVPPGCDGDRRETREHERLKERVAIAAAQAAGWQVETEAAERDPRTGRLAWRADVLAAKGAARVAFEVQLSNADHAAMLARQQRYYESGVRGLWFVRTRKDFPASRALPIFHVDSGPEGDRVTLVGGADAPCIRALTADAAGVDLADFVRGALAGHLKWAPFEHPGATALHACVDYAPADACPGCGRTVAQPFCVRARIADLASYPEFQFARVAGLRRSSGWYQPLVDAVWAAAGAATQLTLRTARGTCIRCAAPLGEESGRYQPETGVLAAALQLKDLPQPRFGSVEQAWLRRWALVVPRNDYHVGQRLPRDGEQTLEIQP